MGVEQYKIGTVTVTSGSNVVTGLGTDWLANLAPGNLFKLDIDGAPIYTILAVDSNTQLRLTVNYAGANAAGQAYMVTRSFTPNGVPLPYQGDADLADWMRYAISKLESLIIEDWTPPTPILLAGTATCAATAAAGLTTAAAAYGKLLTITGTSAGAVTNYPVKITVHYGSGSDSGSDVYCNSHCRSDFGDLRFYAANQTTEYSYWIQSQVNGDNAVVWVNVPSIPASPGTTTLYLNYGNAANTVTTSSGDNTFVLFDAFVSEIIDTAKWNVTNNYSGAITPGQISIVGVPATGYQGLAFDGTYYYVGDSIGNAIYKYNTSMAAQTFTTTGANAPTPNSNYPNSIKYRSDHGSLLVAPGSRVITDAAGKVSEIDATTGSVLRTWDFSGENGTHLYANSDALVWLGSGQILFLTVDGSSPQNYKIGKYTLNDNGTFTWIQTWTWAPVDTYVAQGAEWINGYLYAMQKAVAGVDGNDRAWKLQLNGDNTVTALGYMMLDNGAGTEIEDMTFDGTYVHYNSYSDRTIRKFAFSSSEKWMSVSSSTGAWRVISGKTAFGYNYAIGARAKGVANYPQFIGFSDMAADAAPPAGANNLVGLGAYHSANAYLFQRNRLAAAQAEQAYTGTTNYTSYQIYELQRVSGHAKFYQNGAQLTPELTTDLPTVNLYPVFGMNTGGSVSMGAVAYDWVYLRPFQSPEPANTSWGNEISW